LAKLTLKQRKFADEYIISGNATESYKRAYPSVKKDSTANTNASRMLRNAKVKSYIDERLKEIESEKTASIKEVMEYLSSVMRGEQREQTLIGMGQGFQEKTYIDVSAKDRLKAADLLNKIHQARESKQDETKKEDKLDIYIAKVDGELDEFI
jgi:phage terminase small subunit